MTDDEITHKLDNTPTDLKNALGMTPEVVAKMAEIIKVTDGRCGCSWLSDYYHALQADKELKLAIVEERTKQVINELGGSSPQSPT